MATAYPVSTVSLFVLGGQGTIAQRPWTSQPSEIRHYIQAALAHPDHTELLPFSEKGDAKVILDEIWAVSPELRTGVLKASLMFLQVLNSPVLPGTSRDRLRRLSLKMAVEHNTFPTLLILRGVTCTDHSRHGEGAFGEVFCGTYNGIKVALKFPRMYATMSAEEREALRKASPFYYF